MHTERHSKHDTSHAPSDDHLKEKTPLFTPSAQFRIEDSLKNKPEETTIADPAAAEFHQEYSPNQYIEQSLLEKHTFGSDELSVEKNSITRYPTHIPFQGHEYILDLKEKKEGGFGTVLTAEPVFTTSTRMEENEEGEVEEITRIDTDIHSLLGTHSMDHGVVVKLIAVVQRNEEKQEEQDAFEKRKAYQRNAVLQEASMLFEDAQLVGVQLLENEEHDQVYAIAMEKAKGQTLADFILAGRNPEAPEAATNNEVDNELEDVDLFQMEEQKEKESDLFTREKIASSPERSLILMVAMLQYVKQLQNKIHRDIKPTNLMINPAHPDISKVVDLGFASPIGDVQSSQETGMYKGTPEYSSPEVFKGDEEYRDIYALGLNMGIAMGMMQFNRKGMKHMSAGEKAHETMQRIVFGNYVQAPNLTKENYTHTALYDYAPEREFVFLLYQMVQPTHSAGQYDKTPFPDKYKSIMQRLEEIIRQQTIVVQAVRAMHAAEQHIQNHAQFGSSDDLIVKGRRVLSEAMKQNDIDAMQAAIAELKTSFALEPMQRILHVDKKNQNPHSYESTEQKVRVLLDAPTYADMIPKKSMEQLHGLFRLAGQYNRRDALPEAFFLIKELERLIVHIRETIDQRRSDPTFDPKSDLPKVNMGEILFRMKDANL